MTSLLRRVGVLADDFSGAGDVALAFESAGLTTEIWAPAGGKPSRPAADVRVWILDTESRGLSPHAAAERVRSALAVLAPWRPDFIFKKIDSTLRGPVGAELAAFIGALRPTNPVPFVPAFPRMGRTTADGRHFVGGVPLHRTVFGKDPRHPVRSSLVADVLALTPGIRSQVWVPDVENGRAMAAAARRAVTGRAAVGSAGFAAAIARGMAPRGAPSKRRKTFFDPPGSGYVGVAVGSAHPLSARQTERLKNLSGGSAVFLVERPRRRGVPAVVLRRISDQSRVLEKAHRLRRWIATGGETAFALARIWKESRWRVVEAIEPGIPLCRSLGRRPRWLALKPGGFGSEDALWKAARRMLRKD